jgi:uncharacterized membrane protein YgdD (TMEM256/DUF423 family)
MHKKIYLWASILGAAAVGIGAFGSHLLKSKLKPEDLQVFQTGVQYHFYHVIALFITGFLYKTYKSSFFTTAAILFGFGIMLFSFSLYFLKLSLLSTAGEEKWLSYFTPFGGFLFIAGWLCIVIYFSKRRNMPRGSGKSRSEDSAE